MVSCVVWLRQKVPSVLLSILFFCLHCPTPKPNKLGCFELCGGVHTTQRQTSAQIPIGFPSVSVSVSFCLGVGQCKCTVRVKFVSVSIALFTVNIWHMSDSEMDGCGIWKMEESFAGAINSSSPCGVLLSPRFPGFVEPGYWAWLIEGIDGFYFDIYIYYVRGPQLTGGECGQFFQGKPIEFYC